MSEWNGIDVTGGRVAVARDAGSLEGDFEVNSQGEKVDGVLVPDSRETSSDSTTIKK